MIFRPWRKTAVGNIRDNNAARVAGPGRICFLVRNHEYRLDSQSAELAGAACGWEAGGSILFLRAHGFLLTLIRCARDTQRFHHFANSGFCRVLGSPF